MDVRHELLAGFPTLGGHDLLAYELLDELVYTTACLGEEISTVHRILEHLLDKRGEETLVDLGFELRADLLRETFFSGDVQEEIAQLTVDPTGRILRPPLTHKEDFCRDRHGVFGIQAIPDPLARLIEALLEGLPRCSCRLCTIRDLSRTRWGLNRGRTGGARHADRGDDGIRLDIVVIVVVARKFGLQTTQNRMTALRRLDSLARLAVPHLSVELGDIRRVLLLQRLVHGDVGGPSGNQKLDRWQWSVLERNNLIHARQNCRRLTGLDEGLQAGNLQAVHFHIVPRVALATRHETRKGLRSTAARDRRQLGYRPMLHQVLVVH
eukprot:PhM_4_TR18715/c1_g3_i3/m.62375